MGRNGPRRGPARRKPPSRTPLYGHLGPGPRRTGHRRSGHGRTDTAPADDEGGRIFGVIPNNKTVPTSPLRKNRSRSAKNSSLRPKTPLTRSPSCWPPSTRGSPNGRTIFPPGGWAARRTGSASERRMRTKWSATTSPRRSCRRLLHEDPRYFRKGNGLKRGRIGYALSRVLITRTDGGTNGSTIRKSSATAWPRESRICTIRPRSARSARREKNSPSRWSATAPLTSCLEFWPDMKHAIFKK